MTLADALRGARVYDLEQPRHAGAPVWPAHEPGVLVNLHRRHEQDAFDGRTSASALLVMTEHSGTHMDALCHQAYGGALHGGVRVTSEVQTSTGFTALGIDTVAPIVRRGVLLDVGGASRVTAADLEATGVEVRAGDVALVRLGSGALWSDREAYLAAGGMTADASRWLAARSPFAVGADNVAWDIPDEADPELGTLPGHTILIVQSGIHIIESLFLEELAADGVREFAFVCLPLKLRGGTGSPVRPIALVET
ncbi:MAG TPA: cyclase family protein [Solirubrobacteraceae bacterium]|nr:cyclase family protein [Solirubrobacteraceae bacterium]